MRLQVCTTPSGSLRQVLMLADWAIHRPSCIQFYFWTVLRQNVLLLKSVVWAADLSFILKTKCHCLTWFRIRTEFPITSRLVLNTVLLFCTIYLCKVAFSALKYKIKVLINFEKHWTCCISCNTKYSSRFGSACKNEQGHPSHKHADLFWLLT